MIEEVRQPLWQVLDFSGADISEKKMCSRRWRELEGSPGRAVVDARPSGLRPNERPRGSPGKESGLAGCERQRAIG